MKGIIELSVWQVAFAYIFVLILLLIVRIRKVRREKIIVIASIRMTLQLVLVGYVLEYIFQNPSPWITAGIIMLMEAFAIYTVYQKFKGRLSGPLKKIIAFSLSLGTLLCLGYFLFVVIRIFPWYSPQYFIPIAGMLIGNSMTGVTLGVKMLLDGMSAEKHLIEEALILGATPQKASANMINSAFDAAIMPTINSMLGMGIVILPGMMTGQILSGTSPTTAIAYQIAIMLGILGAVALTVIMLLQFGYRTFFNRDAQLI